MKSPLPFRIGLAAMFLLAAAPLAAQHPHSRLREVQRTERQGFWIGFGVGGGENSTQYRPGPSSYGPGISGGSLSLKLGGTPSRNVLLGGEVYVWFHELGDGTDESLSSAMFITQIYPFDGAGLYFKGGVGLTAYDVSDRFLDFSEEGYGGVLGVGYEIQVGRNVFLVPTVDGYWHAYDGRRERIVNFGLGVTFH